MDSSTFEIGNTERNLNEGAVTDVSRSRYRPVLAFVPSVESIERMTLTSPGSCTRAESITDLIDSYVLIHTPWEQAGL